MSLPETYKTIYSAPTIDGKFEVKELPLQKPGRNQVLVKMEYAPINPTDLYTIANVGFYDTTGKQCQVGSEGSGVVVAVGEDLKIPFKVGDRVHVMRDTWAQYRLADTDKVFHIQDEDLSLEQAASHFINPGTVYYMGKLAAGHKAAINSPATSALGRMLIRYFKHIGIKLINIVRKEEYVEELKREGADYVLNSEAPDFEEKLREIAEKEQATVAFDAVAGDFSGTLLRTMPRGSTLYVYGKLSSTEAKVGIKDLFYGKTVKGILIYEYFEELIKKNEFRKVFEELHSLLSTVLTSNVQKIYKLDDLDEAIEYYNQNRSKGKVLIKLN